ncbi:PREDICTED: protein transport protein SFT2-like [Priapulus caudatus]|uniref:Vesicle transport protein n=1 Tax=Priapulus caudatus TaxID=37621 RepID=A0ABM1F944_PRICU|nr:PREDICTED: protein transport protein SFT2-like [Priapulus caudatus]
MSDINKQLLDYLSQNKSHSSGQDADGESSHSVGKFSWFTQLRRPAISSEANDNAWLQEAQKDPLFPTLTKKQRILGFVSCILMGVFCFVLAWMFFPFLVLKARKFALLYTLGSVFTIGSFAMLWGPVNHVKHIFSAQRLPFTTTYFGSLFGTLYFALVVQSTLLTALCAILQVVALVWYMISYIPGGQTGLSFFSKLFYSVSSKAVSSALPV